MNWRAPLISLAFRLTNREVLRETELLKSLDGASPDRVRALQQQRLERLLLHAWRHTDYYHELLESCGAVRNGNVDLDRFEDIPFLTRDILRSQFERLRARQLPNGRRAYSNGSGGSTGQPVRFLQDNVYWAVTIATRLHHFSMLGKRLGEREMKIWGSERDLFTGTIGLKAKIENFVYNRKCEQCWHLPEDRIRQIISDINTWRPQLLWCYRDGIDAVAKYINDHGIAVHSPRAIALGGATVYPFMVETIERAFHAPVISAYGSREVGAAACQCLAKDGHHIAANAHVIEAIGADERPVLEQDGELAITPLTNYAMPFIRYRIGDRGRLTQRRCPCGRPFPLLASLSGRVTEALVNSNREQVDSLYFIGLLGRICDLGRARRFQVIQETDGSLTINLLTPPGATREALGLDYEGIASKIRLVMGKDCVVRFALVTDIPLSASGKFPYVVRRRSPSGAAEFVPA